MTPREKKLAITLGSLFCILLVFSLVLGFVKNASSFGNNSKALTQRIAGMRELVKAQVGWEEKSLWLYDNIPGHPSEAKASAHLIERIRQLTPRYQLQIESQEIISRQALEEAGEYEEAGGQFEWVGLTIKVNGGA